MKALFLFLFFKKEVWLEEHIFYEKIIIEYTPRWLTQKYIDWIDSYEV
jgi:hypothetical protein